MREGSQTQFYRANGGGTLVERDPQSDWWVVDFGTMRGIPKPSIQIDGSVTGEKDFVKLDLQFTLFTADRGCICANIKFSFELILIPAICFR